MKNFFSLLFLLFFSGQTMAKNPLSKIKRWGYQLHSYSEQNIKTIQNSSDTLWVIDYSKDGTEKNRFSSQEILSFKTSQNIVLSYFCLGEAEVVRYYWKNISSDVFITQNDIEQGLPYQKEFINYFLIDRNFEILSRSNDEYADNFPIKFWNSKWQEMLLERGPILGKSYLERIIETHFDGVYLDTVDAFEYYQESDVEKMAIKMARLVIKLGKYGKARNPNFIILLQNGVWIYELLENHTKLRDELFSYIHGFGIEDLFYPGEGNNNPYNFSRYGEFDYIKKIRKTYDTRFFTVDYIPGLSAKQQKYYFKKAKRKDLIPVISDRDLGGQLILNTNF